DVRAHRYTITNGVLHDAGDFSVAASSTFDETRSSIAMAPNGAFDIAYQFSVSTSDEIALNRYSSTAQLLSSALVAQDPAAEQAPDVAMDKAGNAVVVYQKSNGADFDIKAKRVSTAGALGPELNIRNTGLVETNASVALAPTGGQFAVAYQSGNTLPTSFELAQVSASDALLGISPRVAGIAPVVSVDGFNRELVTYTNVIGS